MLRDGQATALAQALCIVPAPRPRSKVLCAVDLVRLSPFRGLFDLVIVSPYWGPLYLVRNGTRSPDWGSHARCRYGARMVGADAARADLEAMLAA
ncbi:hypothetical protein GmRootV116_37530 [Variovorax sp. V116]